MNELGTEFEYQGRTLKQIKREEMVALYELYGPQGMLYGYELIVIKVAPATTVFGKDYPERELYPSSSKNSNDWGNIAWSFGRSQKEEAFQSFENVVRKQRNKPTSVPPRARSSNLETSEGEYSEQ